MAVQETQIVNVEYMDSMINRINTAKDCSELQQFSLEAIESISGVKQKIVSELAKVSPYLALLDPPTTPSEAVSWVTNYISGYLTQQMKPAITYAAQLTATIAQIALLTAAIEAAATRFPDCTVTIPPPV